MRRFLLFAFLILGFSVPAKAQFTTLTATPVKDSTGAAYVNCRGNAAFVPSPTATQQALLSGSVFQTDVPIASCDSFGNMTIILADNNQITDGHTGQGSQWRLNISSQDGKTNFSCTLTVTGAAQNATAAVQACAPLLPPQGGGGGGFTVRTVPCASTIAFTMAGFAPNTANTAFNLALNCNVTSTSVVGSGGPIQVGAVAQFTLTQNNVGGFTFAWPSNFLDQPAIQVGANTTTNASFWFDGTNWHAQTFPASGGGGGNSAGVSGDIQKGTGTGAFAVAGINDNGTVVKVKEDIQFNTGPNPYIDGRGFGMRAVVPTAVPAIPGITANCTNGSPNVTISAPSTFQNGDGVALYGCGVGTIAAPAAPTVTPVLIASQTETLLDVPAPAGSTTYCYQLVDRKLLGATNVSPETCTTTGPASLGLQSVAITSVSLSNTTATYTTAPHGLAVGAHVVITNIAVNTINGQSGNGDSFRNPFNCWCTVATVPDTTHFTVNLLSDSRNGAVTAGTGGTVNYWNAIKIKATETTANFQYYLYGRVSGGTKTLIGTMWPQNSSFLGDATYLVKHDLGSPVTTFPNPPSYLPTTVPTSATNDMLPTTIVSGAGSTSLVLANNAGNSISGATIVFDDAVTFLAGATAATNYGANISGPLMIPWPGSNTLYYVFNSPISLGTGATTGLSVLQKGNVWLNEPITTSNVDWHGQQSSGDVAVSFANQITPLMAFNKCSPCIYAAFNTYFYDLAWSQQSTNGSLMFIQDNGGIPAAGAFNNMSFVLGTTTSYSNMAAVFRGGAGWHFSGKTVFTASQNGNLIGTTPALYFDLIGNVKFDTLNLSGIGGVAFRVNPAGGFSIADAVYSQGTYSPYFSIVNSGAVMAMAVRNVVFDTTNIPLVANYGGSVLYLDLINSTASPNGNPHVTGSFPPGGAPRTSIRMSGSTNTPINTGTYIGNVDLSAADGTFGRGNTFINILNRGMALGPAYSFFSTTGPPAAPTSCPVSAGGSVPVGLTYYFYVPVYPGGSEGTISLFCTATTTSGNQTVTVNWTAIPGVTQYNLYRGTSQSTASLLNCAPSTGTTYVDSVAVGCGGSVPATAAGGPAGIRGSLAWSQTNQIGLTSHTSVATAIRNIVWPDLAGTPALINAAQTWTSNQTLTNASQLRFLSTNGTNYAGFQGGASTTNLVWLFPTTDSSGTQCLASNGSLQLSFTACSGGTGTPGGANTQVQYNNTGTFGGSTNLTWISPALSIGTTAGATGQVKYVGTTSGTVTTQSQDTAGTWTFRWPNSAGTAGFPMTTDGTGVGSWSLLGFAGGGTNQTTFTANQLVTNTAGSLASLAGTLTGTNPVLTLTSAAIGNVPFALNTPASPTADILDVNINSVKTSWVDNLGIWHAPSYTASGTGALAFSGTEGSCPTPAGGIDILCIGNVVTHTIQSSLNGLGYKDNAQFSNSGPAAHGVCLVGVIFPQLNCTSAGLTGQAFVSQGAALDGIFTTLGVVGGGTGNTTNTLGAVMTGAGTSPLVGVGPSATADFPLLNNVAAAPSYRALPLGGSAVTGILLPANGGTGFGSLAAASIVTVTGAITPNNCVKWSASTVVTDSGGTCGGAGGSARLDQLLGGTATNTINSTVFPQTWNWALTGSTTAFKRGENTAATGTNNILDSVSTLSGSTAVVAQWDNNGNGYRVGSTGLLQPVGTGTFATPGAANNLVVSRGSSAAVSYIPPVAAGKVLIDGGPGVDPSFQDPVVSQAFVNIWTTQDVTTTRTSANIRNPIFSQTGTLQLTWASITGSPATCTLQIQGVDSVGNALNNGSTFAVSPANGTTSQNFTAAASLQSAAQIRAIFVCGTYPTAGTLTLDYTPIPNVNVTNTVTVAGTVTTTPPTNASTNIAQINGVTPLMGNGVTGTGSPRVTIASDNTAFAVNNTQQGTASQNVAQVNGITTLTGNGVTGTGSQRVTIASDNTAFSVNATDVGNLGHNGTTATTNRIATLDGIARMDYAGGVALTSGNNAALDIFNDGALHVAALPAMRPTSYHWSASFAGSSTTFAAHIAGNATTTLLVTKIMFSCTQTTAGNVTVTVNKTSAASTGGTAATITAVPDDSNYVAASSVAQSFTGTGPTVGTLVGQIDAYKLGCMATATATPNDIYILNLRQKPIVLRGTAQTLEIGVGAATTGGNYTVTFEGIETAPITP